MKAKSQEKHEQAGEETDQSRKQKNILIHGRQEDREEEGKKGKKAKAVEDRKERVVLQPVLQKLSGNQKKNQDQEEELGTCKGSAFEIKDDIAREQASKTELHGPWEKQLHFEKPPRRSYAALPPKSEHDHGADEDQVKEQNDVVDRIVDARHRQ